MGEANNSRALLVLDDFDRLPDDALVAEELRKFLTTVLLRTERLSVLLGARETSYQALGAHKVVAFHLESLRPTDAARLFLWRVHRPLVVADLSENAGEA